MAARVLLPQPFWKPVAAVRQLRFKSFPISAAETSENFSELASEERSSFTFPFARAKVGQFFQQEPQLGNQFTEDTTLQNYLKRHMSEVDINLGNSLDKLRHPRSDAYSAEQVLLNKQQIWCGGDCYLNLCEIILHNAAKIQSYKLKRMICSISGRSSRKQLL